MSYQVHVRCAPPYKPLSDGLEAAAVTALTYVDVAPGEITIVLVDQNEIQDLNRKFAKCDAPTDVLSFADSSSDKNAGIRYYGDVIIAVPIAEMQADIAGHSLETELALLAIHGVLHLLDYDHDNLEEREPMWNAQTTILESLGYHITSPE